MKLKMNKRAIQFEEIPAIIMLFVIAAMIGSAGVLVLGKLKETSSVGENVCRGNCSLYPSDYNASLDYGIASVKELLSWNQTLAVIFIAVILISAVMLFGRSRSV